MPTFEQDIKVISCYRVRVEADDEYDADDKIGNMSEAEVRSHRHQWTEKGDYDQLPEEV